ncbi:UNVERIFIED_ORG: hypothetical protein M2414_005177 [Rahnella aquatilis]
MKRSLFEFVLLWDTLSDINVIDDAIEESILHFALGTCRYDIWSWFESECAEISAAVAIMGGYAKCAFSALAFTGGADTLIDGFYINRIYLSERRSDSYQARKKLIMVCEQLQSAICSHYNIKGCYG